jgi:hypothetical protein
MFSLRQNRVLDLAVGSHGRPRASYPRARGRFLNQLGGPQWHPVGLLLRTFLSRRGRATRRALTPALPEEEKKIYTTPRNSLNRT